MEDAGRDGRDRRDGGFLRHFVGFAGPAPARKGAKVIYPLDKVLLLCLLAVLVGAEAITDIARSGDKKLACSGGCFADGTPTHDHLGES